MTSRLLALPGELKLQILEQLSPSETTSSGYDCDDCRTLAEDIEVIFRSVWDVRNLAQSCRELRSFCGKVSYHGVRLVGEEGYKRFLEDLDKGTLPTNISDRPNTKFLSFGRFIPHNHDCEWLCCNYYQESKTIERICTHFSSITTLELINFPLFIANIYALSPLSALQTLSILDPDPDAHKAQFVSTQEHLWPKPPLSNVSVVVSDFRACSSTSNLLKVFANRITTLSIKSDETKVEDSGKTVDFLRVDALYLAHTVYIRMTKLKHLSIGYLKMTSESFRNFLTSCKTLESLSVNCRGMNKPLPLFYVLDLMLIITGESDDDVDMMGYDWLPENAYEEMDMQPPGALNPYIDSSRIWTRGVASFRCSFTSVVEPRPGSDTSRTTKHLELVLGSGTDADMKFEELTEVFHDRAMSFQKLESLSIKSSDEMTLQPSESEDNLKATIREMHRRDLPSVTEMFIKWGEIEAHLDYSERQFGI